jgi:hypothetical protein
VATLLLIFCLIIFPPAFSAAREWVYSPDYQRFLEHPSAGNGDLIGLVLVMVPIIVEILCNT